MIAQKLENLPKTQGILKNLKFLANPLPSILTENRPKKVSSSDFRHIFCLELAEKSSKVTLELMFIINFPPTVSSTHIVSVRTFLDEKNWHKPAKTSGGGEVKKVDPNENPTLLGHGKFHYS